MGEESTEDFQTLYEDLEIKFHTECLDIISTLMAYPFNITKIPTDFSKN